MSESSDFNLTLSCVSNLDEATNDTLNTDKINIKTYPIRCSNCSNISILNADFKKNYFCTICDNSHKNEYNSFSSFLSGANKDLSKMLCNICQKSNDEISLYKCNTCNLFYCKDCKVNHTEKNYHYYFQEINKFDGFCPIHDKKFKYFNLEKKSHICEICYNNNIYKNKKRKNIEIEKIVENKDVINREYNKLMENILICNNIQKIIYEWLNELSNKVKNYCETLNNYYLIQKSILHFLKNDEIYNYNFNALINYSSFKNKNNIDLYIQQINSKINNFYNRSTNIFMMSNNFIQILNDFNDISFIINGENAKNFYSKKTHAENSKKFPKLENMKRKKIDIGSEIKCFSSLNNDKNLVLGLKNGKIQIFEISQKEIKCKLEINEFLNEIQSIKELDTNLFVVADSSSKIKIIELENELKSYKIVQSLRTKDDSENIYCMTNLPNLSFSKKRHFFCTGDENHILIWKSNKEPKNLGSHSETYADNINCESSEEEETSKDDEQPLKFTLFKDIELKTLTRCLIEVNDKYIVAACTKKQSVKIFDIEDNFREIYEFKNMPITSGSNILSYLPQTEEIIVGCTDGVRHILTNKFEMKIIHCNYMVTSLICVDNKYILNCGINNKESKIRQYKFDEFRSYSKSSEKNLHENEVWYFKIINKKIFYSNKNNLYFLE